MTVDSKILLEKIFKSSAFNKSDIHKRLLSYLIECDRQNKTPNEYDIAIHVLERDEDFNSADDTIVRASIYRLRKKLDAYYSKEGKHEHIRLTIPKGHYNIVYVKKSSSSGSVMKKRPVILGILIALFIILIGISIWQISKKNRIDIRGRQSSQLKIESEIWSNYFNNDLPCDVVIGDYYIFEEYNARLGRRRRVMDYIINTEKEFYDYKEKFPETEYNVLPIGELPHHSIYNIQDVSSVFYSFNRRYKLKMSSKFELNETLKHNILYLGDFKSLRILESFILNQNVRFEYTQGFGGKLFVLNAQQDTVKIFDNSHIDLSKESKSIDYCMVYKSKGPNNENYLFFIGFGYISQLETVNIFCLENRIVELENKIKQLQGYIPEEFLMVLEITGLYLTPYYYELSYFRELDK